MKTGMEPRRSWLAGIFLFVLGAIAATFSAGAQTAQAGPLPSIVQKDGRSALMVDGAPYLMLGVQANNSSAWPVYLDKVWPAAETLHANTVELPVYWEQVEATQGKYRFQPRRSDSESGARASSASGAALVRHMEERQFALHAGVDQAGSGEVPLPGGQGRPDRRFAFYLLTGEA